MRAHYAQIRTRVASKEHPHQDITPDLFYKNRFTKASFALVAMISVFTINTFSLYLYLMKAVSILWVINAIHILTACIFIAGIVFLPYHIRHYGFNTKKLGRNITIGLIVGAAGLALSIYTRRVMIEKGHDIYRCSFTISSFINLLLFYPCVAFFQELIIKGYLQSILVSVMGKDHLGKLGAIVLSSLVFCQLHIHYNIYMPYIVLSAFLFSIITGYIYEKTRSVIGISIIHYLCGAGMTAFLTIR